MEPSWGNPNENFSAVLSCGTVYYAVKMMLTYWTVDEILVCGHFSEYYWTEWGFVRLLSTPPTQTICRLVTIFPKKHATSPKSDAVIGIHVGSISAAPSCLVYPSRARAPVPKSGWQSSLIGTRFASELNKETTIHLYYQSPHCPFKASLPPTRWDPQSWGWLETLDPPHPPPQWTDHNPGNAGTTWTLGDPGNQSCPCQSAWKNKGNSNWSFLVNVTDTPLDNHAHTRWNQRGGLDFSRGNKEMESHAHLQTRAMTWIKATYNFRTEWDCKKRIVPTVHKK